MLSFPGKLQGSCDPKIANNKKPDLIPTTQSVDGCFTLLHHLFEMVSFQFGPPCIILQVLLPGLHDKSAALMKDVLAT